MWADIAVNHPGRRAGAGPTGDWNRMFLNALATRSRLDEDDTKMREGTLGYLRKSEPRYLAFLARGCDTLEVELAPGYLGLDLYDALRHAGDSGRAMATRHGFQWS